MKEKVLRVNMTEKEIITEEWDSRKMPLLGGRAFTSKILAEEVDPTCHPVLLSFLTRAYHQGQNGIPSGQP